MFGRVHLCLGAYWRMANAVWGSSPVLYCDWYDLSFVLAFIPASVAALGSGVVSIGKQTSILSDDISRVLDNCVSILELKFLHWDNKNLKAKQFLMSFFLLKEKEEIAVVHVSIDIRGQASIVTRMAYWWMLLILWLCCCSCLVSDNLLQSEILSNWIDPKKHVALQ